MNRASVSVVSSVVTITGALWFWVSSPVRAAEPNAMVAFRYGGIVLDQTTKPVAGAKVAVIGTDRSATTDAKGAFEVTGNIPADAVRLGQSADSAALPFLEVSAKGHEPVTFRPASTDTNGLTCTIWSFTEPKEGDPVDLARWCYIYRKGFAANPPETRWLPPDNTILCGLMWESARPLGTLEIEFAGLVLDDAKLTASCSIAAGWPSWWQSQKIGEAMTSPEDASTEASRSTSRLTFAFPPGKPCDKAAVRYAGPDKDLDRFAIHLYAGAKWKKPLDVEIEWGFQEDSKGRRHDGYIEAFQGYATDVQPLVPGGGVTIAGNRHWRDDASTSDRRGIVTRIWLTDNPADGYKDRTPFGNRTVVTLWTGCGNVSFAPSDLDNGPILIPSAGIFVAKRESGVTAVQFQKQVAASGKKTVRQRAREHRDMNWTAAMNAVRPGKTLPPIPEPATNQLPSGMQIEVPEEQLNDQYRLSVAHIQANTHKLDDDTYMVCIWPAKTALASESFQILRAYDLIGLPYLAEGGLNYWLLSAKPVSPKGNVIRRDTYREHKEGHGRIQATAGFHYRMTRNDEWLGKVLPELLATHEHTQQLRNDWSGRLPQDSWAFGLLPPYPLSGDLGGYRMTYRLDAGFYEGMLEVAGMVARTDPDRGRAIMKEAEEYRRAIRSSVDRATALTPVIVVQDGTYRRYMPHGPYTRGLWPQFLCHDGGGWRMYHDNLGNGLSLCWRGVYAPDDALVQDTFDVVEDVFLQNPGKSAEPWFDLSGYHNQCGHEPQSFAHFLAGDVHMSIRSLYVQYASEIRPDRGYRFQEHPFTNGFTGDPDKSFEEAAFLERVRMLLVQEEGETLWLSRFALREWFEQGKKINVKNAPTFFGPVDYEIISDADNGKINATVKMPARNPPKEVWLRLRHPKSAPIKSVTVNGKEWKEFDATKEVVKLRDLKDSVSVEAKY